MKTVKLLALLVFALLVTGCFETITEPRDPLSQPPILYTIVNNSSSGKDIDMSSIFIFVKQQVLYSTGEDIFGAPAFSGE